jgi:GNAT superfamily N-acetyltransferase
MEENFAVRRATMQDADSIRKLADELGYRTAAGVMDQRVCAVVAANNGLLLVAANSANEPVGWIQAHSVHLIDSGFCVEILGLVISVTTRRAGLGRLLVAAVEAWAARINAEAIILRTNVTRGESHPFYLALGYEKTKTSQAYRKILAPAPP